MKPKGKGSLLTEQPGGVLISEAQMWEKAEIEAPSGPPHGAFHP